MHKAVCALIRKDNLILAVARKYDDEDFGLPGGSVESFDESDEAALKREVKEETGVDISNIKYVFTRSDSKSIVKTFTCDISGEPKTQKNEGVVKWVTPQILTHGSFGKYNKKLFEVMNIDL